MLAMVEISDTALLQQRLPLLLKKTEPNAWWKPYFMIGQLCEIWSKWYGDLILVESNINSN